VKFELAWSGLWQATMISPLLLIAVGPGGRGVAPRFPNRRAQFALYRRPLHSPPTSPMDLSAALFETAQQKHVTRNRAAAKRNVVAGREQQIFQREH
jgi:hypothetical protein